MRKLKYIVILVSLFPVLLGFKTLYVEKNIIVIRSDINQTGKKETDLNKRGKYNVTQISRCEWNDRNGLPYRKTGAANLGATSFIPTNKNKTVFLSDATDEIITIDNNGGKALKRFKVSFAPRDFTYDPPYFYVLSESEVAVFSEDGREIKKYTVPGSSIGVERLTRYDKATYLLLPTGNSLKIEQGGNAIEPKEYNGWITGSGMFIKTRIGSDNSYFATTITTDGTTEKRFFTDKKVAGVFVIGANLNRIVLDVQSYVSENPISIERHIVSIEKTKKGMGEVVADTKIPDCYYVLSNKDFHLSENGRIYNMLTAPSGMFVFSLNETKSATSKKYPTSLSTINYHFNNHLLKVEK